MKTTYTNALTTVEYIRCGWSVNLTPAQWRRTRKQAHKTGLTTFVAFRLATK